MTIGNQRHSRLIRVLAGLWVATTVAACGGGGSSGSGSGVSGGDILIGASIPLSGPLAGFGAFEKWGYQHAVDTVNKAGGIMVDGQKRQVKLILLDDQTDPNVTVNNVTRLITREKVEALLGSCTDSLVEPGALIADRMGVPMVTACAATNTFGPTKQWKWAWDLFFNSEDLTEAPFNTVDDLGLQTNKKVAIIHSNGKNENVIGEQEWPKWAAKHGWQVVYNAAFPPTTTQFTSAVASVKASGADMFLTVFPPPPAIALRKQLAAAGYTPKIMVIEEGGEPVQFATALGKLADGVMVGGYWDPSFPYPGAQTLRQQFESETGQTFSQHIADTSTAAQILIDALGRAATLDKTKVNDEIAKTDKTYVVGPIKFGDDHTSTLPMVEEQWQDGKSPVIWPKKLANATVIFPMPSG
ncbi:MAG: branched-chain amino acid transport system substrate-binding protein [Mycobacteriales bacterium]